MRLGTAEVLVKAKTDQYDRDIDRSEGRIKSFGRTSEVSLNKADAAFTSFSRSVVAGAGAIGVAFGAVEVVQFGKDVVDVGVKLDSLKLTYESITGSVQGMNDELSFVNGISKTYGLSLSILENGYKDLLAASKGTALEGEAIRKIFDAISQSSAGLGLSVDDTNGVIRAFGQMISKGNVQAEELRGQVGERLPGAFQLAARAMGVSTQELNKMLERGEVLATDLLPKLAVVLTDKYGEAAVKAGESSRAAFVGFENAVLELKRTLGESGITETMAELARGATEMTNSLVKAGPSLQKMLLYGYSGKGGQAYWDAIDQKRAMEKSGGAASKPIDESTAGYDHYIKKPPPYTQKELEDLQKKNREKYALTIALGEEINKAEQESWRIRAAHEKRMNNVVLGFVDHRTKEEIELERQYQKEAMNRANAVKDSWMVREEGLKRAEDAALQMRGMAGDVTSDWSNAFSGWAASFSSELNEMLWGSELTFEGIAESFGKMITQMIIQEQALKAMKSFSSVDWGSIGSSAASWFTANAQGNIYSGPGISAYENQIVNKPTIFPFARGVGLMGEEGDEAIMPLKRMSSGNLGVEASGGGGGIVMHNTFNIESSGDEEQDKNLAEMIAMTIEVKTKAILRDEMRVGGMLNSSINRSYA